MLLGYSTTLDSKMAVLEKETKVKSWQLEVQEMKVKCFSLCRGNMMATNAEYPVLWGKHKWERWRPLEVGQKIHIPLEPITRIVLSGGEDCCIARGPKKIHQNENGTWNRWN